MSSQEVQHIRATLSKVMDRKNEEIYDFQVKVAALEIRIAELLTMLGEKTERNERQRIIIEQNNVAIRSLTQEIVRNR